MPAHLSINDTQATIGEERIVVNNPVPPSNLFMSSLQVQVNVLEAHILNLEQRVQSLEQQLTVLAQRTWWSMLKDWIHGLHLLPFHHR